MPLTPILKKRLSVMNSACKRVLFSTREPARSVILKYRETGNSSHFDKIFEDLAASSTTFDLLSWLNQMTDCVTLLDRQADQLVLEFLKIPWFRPNLMEVAVGAEDFFTTLVSAHNYYAYLVLKHLFTLLIPEVDESDSSLLEKAGVLSAEEEECYRHVLSTIVAIQDHVPLIRDNLVVLARKSIPYFTKHVHQHAVYTRNLLLLAKYLPHLRVSLLEIIINNMVTIDVYTPRSELVPVEEEEEEEEEDGSDDEEIFPMEVEELKDKQVETADDPSSITRESVHILNHKNGNTLDVLMCIMFQYVHDVCHDNDESGKPTELRKKFFHYKFPPDPLRDEEQMCQAGSVSLSGGNTIAGCKCRGSKHNLDALKLLYTELKEVFSRTILIVEASSYVQFLLFYLLALRPGLATFFIEFLRVKKFENPNCSRDVRRNAMAYIGSLLARGKFIPFDVVHSCLEIICMWCNTYLDNQVIIGGGRQELGAPLEDNAEKKCVRTDGRNLVQEWKNAKASQGETNAYVTTTRELRALDIENTEYIMGLFGDLHVPYDVDRNTSLDGTPSLKEMVQVALRRLMRDDGFFLLVEGGRIDHGLHYGQPLRALEELLAMEEAVEATLEMVNLEETLIVVTADHSHVMTINGYPERGNNILGVVMNEDDVSDHMPYTTLMFTNGPGFNYTWTGEKVMRRNLTGVDTNDKDFKPLAAVPTYVGSETHGGEDVGVYAIGPMAHLFHRVHEQNYVAHVMAYASCIGPYKDDCERPLQIHENVYNHVKNLKKCNANTGASVNLSFVALVSITIAHVIRLFRC